MTLQRPRLLPALLLIAVLGGCDEDSSGTVYNDVPPRLEAERIVLFVPGDDTDAGDGAERLAARGVSVIRMAPAPGADGDLHALAIKEHLRTLYSRGIDPRRLALVGHRAGGRIVLSAAALLRDPQLAFVVVDACRDGAAIAAFAETMARTIEGRLLSLRTKEHEAATCGPILEAANGAETWEAETGDDAWVRETLLWTFPDTGD